MTDSERDMYLWVIDKCELTDSDQVQLKEKIHEVWKRGMTDAITSIRNDEIYAGVYWHIKAIERDRDETQAPQSHPQDQAR